MRPARDFLFIQLSNTRIRNPSLKNIFKIAEAFDCSIDYLAGRQDSAS